MNTETLYSLRKAVHKAGVAKAAAVAKQRNKKKNPKLGNLETDLEVKKYNWFCK